MKTLNFIYKDKNVICKINKELNREQYIYYIKLGGRRKLCFGINNWADENGIIKSYSEERLKAEFAEYWDVKKPKLDAEFAEYVNKCKKAGVKP